MAWNYAEWARKKQGNPAVLAFSLICFATSGIIGYKKLYQPWKRRRLVDEYDQYAQFIYDSELKRRNQS